MQISQIIYSPGNQRDQITRQHFHLIEKMAIQTLLMAMKKPTLTTLGKVSQ